MALLGETFDATQHQPANFEPIPAGKYPMAIVDSEMKDTRNGRGQYLQLVCQILDGEQKGRKVFERLNLVNENATAVNIAQSTLAAICNATGVQKVNDSVELHDKPFLGSVKIRPASGQYEAGNEMKGYESLQGYTPQAVPLTTGEAPQTPAPVAAPAPNSKPAWAQ